MRPVKTQDGKIHYVHSEEDLRPMPIEEILARSKTDELELDVANLKKLHDSNWQEAVNQLTDLTVSKIINQNEIVSLTVDYYRLKALEETLIDILRHPVCKFFGKLFCIYYIDNCDIVRAGKPK